MKKNPPLREELMKVWCIAVALLTLFPGKADAQGTVQTDVPRLKDVYAGDFSIGCLLSYAHVGFPTDPPVPGQSTVVTPQGGDLIKFHMNSMSPGNWMKAVYIVDLAGSASAYTAAATQAEKDSIDVHPKITFNGNIIAQLNWAQRQGFTFRGHTLVWHSQTPGTAFFQSGYTGGGARLTKQKMTERLENYIKEVIRLLHESWPGLLSAIDVVNEAVYDSGNDRTESEWWVTFGDNSYIMKAFEFARKYTVQYGETQIKLYYNDYNTHVSSKADGIVRVCTPIFQAGFLDGIGMQDHDQISSPTAAQWIASYNKFSPICTEISVTELDVAPGSSSQTMQANQYAQLFKCFVERSARSGRGKIVSVSKDGLNDQWAFVANASLWNNQMQCKPSFYAVVNVGINYNKLDSLIAYSATLREQDYSATAWGDFSAVYDFAVGERDKNYSASLSAADGLGQAKDTLQYALDVLLGLPVSVAQGDADLPAGFALGQNYPNPFNPSTTIEYSLVQRSIISLKVFNLFGEEVATLFEGVREAGRHHATFDASGLGSGVYFYQLRANNHIEAKKLVILK